MKNVALFLLLSIIIGSLASCQKQINYNNALSGIGFWIIYRLFTLNGVIRKYNKQIAYECGFTNDDVIKLGLYQ